MQTAKFLIYPTKDAASPLCRLTAEGKRAAMKKARAMFRVGKGAYAVPVTTH